MKIFEIKLKSDVIGYLFCNDKYDDCYIEINDEFGDLPLPFNIFLEKGIKVLNSDYSYKWIKERVIPYERQNIIDILRDNNYKYYNELMIFIDMNGKSSMDEGHLIEIKKEHLKNNIINRRKKLIKDFIALEGRLIVFFENGKTKICNIKNNNKPFLNQFASEIIYDSSSRYTYLELYEMGKDFPLTYDDLLSYINDNIYNVSKIKEQFDYSRQYVHELKQKDKIIELNNNLFIKNNLLTFNNK